MMTRKTDTKTLLKAMRILARDIQSDDGVANGAISEAADRMEELQAQHRKDDDAYVKLWQMYGDLEAERDRLRAAVKTALMHMISYVNPTDAKRELIAVLRKAILQEDRDE